MTSSYILVLSILVLGGLIAALGDRLGSKVGKARLTIGNLRPKQTAIVVTVLTGTLIAASTFSILLISSKSLREGLFRLDKIQKQLRIAEADLERLGIDKKNTEKELRKVKSEQYAVEKKLEITINNFNTAKQQLKSAFDQALKLRSDIQTLLNERKELRQSKINLDKQIKKLKQEINNRDQELGKGKKQIIEQTKILNERQNRLQSLEKRQSILKEEIDRRDAEIIQLDQDINGKDIALKNKESQLQQLEKKSMYLQRQMTILEQYYQTYQELRERKIAIVRGQVLSIGAVRLIVSKANTQQVVDELLRQANRTVIELIGKNTIDSDHRVVKITQSQVQQLIQELRDNKEYVVRIIAAGNYVQGEKEVRVFADVALNQTIFRKEETISVISIDSLKLTEEVIQQKLDLLLLSATQFHARRSGVLGGIQVADGRLKTLVDFIESIRQSQVGLDKLKAIAMQDTKTIGPLKLKLLGIKGIDIVLETKSK
ncbi:DUF3084 domain-containing protein [Candidatus Atelocyanobacterium thalassae]|uniref:Uncharacterized conserved protein with myosin-like domain n=1 Tax=Atelocyanobacterium thalassa (isolate ALOHA) TaxID=1453429 RepID=D3EQ29_ATETH|nr:DUF3084 domain-containing protein [Candidatus Atelocyanobacterium thalassa]ADB95579.1 uncharacterized conserved protein with myosin-like domain [Candidatus Atelocyanobacterium thalassa isolate ALOHA]